MNRNCKDFSTQLGTICNNTNISKVCLKLHHKICHFTLAVCKTPMLMILLLRLLCHHSKGELLFPSPVLDKESGTQRSTQICLMSHVW